MTTSATDGTPAPGVSDLLPFAGRIATGEVAVPESPVPDGVVRHIGRLVDAEAGETVRSLDKVLTGDHVGPALEWLQRCGALAVLLPEVEALVGFHEHYPQHHKDLWTHTVEVVARTRADADLRWAALLHDVGKTSTRANGADGRVGFLRHEAVGAWLARGVGARLAMPPERIDRVSFVIEFHARVNAYEKSWTDKALRRLVRDAGDRLPDLLAFASADYTTKRRDRAARIRSNLRDLTTRLEALAAEETKPAALPSGIGRALCHALDLTPGPAVGALITWLRAEVTEGRLPAGATAETYIAAAREKV